MKLLCLQENLKNALNTIERSTGQNSTLPILSNILLIAENGQLKILATNLEIGVITWIPAKIEGSGEVCIQVKIINGFINNINNGKIDLEYKNNILNIKKDNYSANILTTDPKSFPIIPKIKSHEKIKIKQQELKRGLIKVLNSAAINDLKPEITGVYFGFKKDNIKIATTDSFRLAEKQISFTGSIGNKNSFILPIKTAQELSRLLKENSEDVFLLLDENQVMFEFDNIQVFSKLIDGEYPDYEQIIPKNFKLRVVIKKQEFLNSLKIASIFCGKTNDVKIKINKNNIEVISRDSEKGENRSEILAQVEGEIIETAFNYKYLLDGLNNMEDEEVIFCFNEKNTPALILPTREKDYRYLVMPIRSI